jgi:hypothetical protein
MTRSALSSPVALIWHGLPGIAWGAGLLLTACAWLSVSAQSAAGDASDLAGEGQANLTWAKFPSEFADYNCIQGVPFEELPVRPAFCRSDKPLKVDAMHTPFATTMILDESGGTGSGYDRLYVDYNRNGTYTDDPVYKAEPFQGKASPDRQPVRAYFSDVLMPRIGNPNARPRVQIFLGFGNVSWIPQTWAVGTLTLGGRTMPAALVDANWNGNVTVPGGYQAGQSVDTPPKGSYLFLGIDGEKQLRPPTSLFVPGEGGSARGFLTKNLVLESGTYEMKAQQGPSGANLSLVRARVPAGTVRMTTPPDTSHILLMGQSTCVMLSGRPTEIAVPADTYLFMNRGYSDNVFSVKEGQAVQVSPLGRQGGPVSLMAEATPAVESPPSPVAPGESLDKWTQYVRDFIAGYKLDMAQESQAWSILKNLQARAQEYRISHKTDYIAARTSADQVQARKDLAQLEAPIEQMFEDLKRRLALIPTETQRAARNAGPSAAKAPATQAQAR